MAALPSPLIMSLIVFVCCCVHVKIGLAEGMTSYKYYLERLNIDALMKKIVIMRQVVAEWSCISCSHVMYDVDWNPLLPLGIFQVPSECSKTAHMLSHLGGL